MNIELQNIGIIEKASVKLDGVTVITGLNDSGKSTVGKALYGLFHGMNFYQDSIDRDRVDYLMTPFLRKLKEEKSEGLNLKKDYFTKRYELINIIDAYFNDDIDKEDLDEEKKYSLMKSRLKVIIEKAGWGQEGKEEIINEFEKRFQEVMQPSFLLRVKKNVVQQTFVEEFTGKYCNIFKDDMARISVFDDENCYEIKMSNDEIYGLEKTISDALNFEDVVLIDTPMIINRLTDENFLLFPSAYQGGHQRELINKIMNPSEKLKFDNIIESSMANENIRNLNVVLNKIEKIINGDLSIDNNRLFYEIKGKKISVSSLASGMKTYVIIKRLISNGYLNKKSLLIIDEPEVHLHPEWQMDFAELLVLLQKEIGIRVILTTHSPYFLEAIEVYSKKNGIADSAHFYLAERVDSGAVLKPIDDNIEETYKMLVRPFIKLRDMENELLTKEKAIVEE